MTERPITCDTPSASNWLCERIWSQVQTVSDGAGRTRVSVIGIDGPTAAGKTRLAEAMRAFLVAEERECWIYQMDWTLVARPERVRDLEFFQATDESFIYEGELHMRLENVESFLRKVTAFNQCVDVDTDTMQEDVDLQNLYSRDDDGQEVGIASCRLRPASVRGALAAVAGGSMSASGRGGSTGCRSSFVLLSAACCSASMAILRPTTRSSVPPVLRSSNRAPIIVSSPISSALI